MAGIQTILPRFMSISGGPNDRVARCELPANWLSESIGQEGGRLVLDVETETGHIRVTAAHVRLICNGDLAVLIPPIDT
jgi:hypothetical protein